MHQNYSSFKKTDEEYFKLIKNILNNLHNREFDGSALGMLRLINYHTKTTGCDISSLLSRIDVLPEKVVSTDRVVGLVAGSLSLLTTCRNQPVWNDLLADVVLFLGCSNLFKRLYTEVGVDVLMVMSDESIKETFGRYRNDGRYRNE